MADIKSSSDRNEKVKQILEVSQKRFGLYGIEKTSMREIADDLRLSKASLYYYFPDKESLYIAVVEKEQKEFLRSIAERISSIEEPEQLLLEYSGIRLTYFRTLLNLSRLRLDSFPTLKPVFKESLKNFREKEKEIIQKILEKGKRKGTFHVNDTEKMASLYLDLLKGLRSPLVNEKVTLSIDQHEFDELKKKTLDFTAIFIRGLKTKDDKLITL
jgi:AcrR family transcriptional regulator